MALPNYLIKKIPKQENIRQVRTLIDDQTIHTVCESAKCPNIGECFARQTLTFMILGNICTRNCTFCGVDHGHPLPPDPDEPLKIAAAVKKLGLNYVVITSVTRDDLPDGGASQFSKVIKELLVTVEVLVPDFQGSASALKIVLEARPYVLNHNIETISRLYGKIRPQADYQRSLNLLQQAKKLNNQVYTKSGFMVGLGEEKGEVFDLLTDLQKTGCDLVTIGQYLPPSRQHLKPVRYVEPSEFAEYKLFGERLGLKVFAGPLVRSSYRAEEISQ